MHYPEVLGDGKDKVSGSGLCRERASELIADHFRQHHGNGLAHHDALSLNAAHTPAYNAEAVDHGCVRVGAHQRVAVEKRVALEHDAAQVLKIHLVCQTAC